MQQLGSPNDKSQGHLHGHFQIRGGRNGVKQEAICDGEWLRKKLIIQWEACILIKQEQTRGDLGSSIAYARR